MSSTSFDGLLAKLLEATRNRKVQWVDTAKDTDFRVAFGGGVIRVMHDNRDSESPYGVALLNRSGKEIETLWPSSRDDSHATLELAYDLYRAARSSALNLDGLLEAMSEALDSGKMDELPSDESDDDIPF